MARRPTGNWDPRGFLHWLSVCERCESRALPLTTLDETTMHAQRRVASTVFWCLSLWRRDYTDDCYDELLKASMEEFYLYRSRGILIRPASGTHPHDQHLIWREARLASLSALMLFDQDTVGKYTIFFRSGRTLETPDLRSGQHHESGARLDPHPHEE